MFNTITEKFTTNSQVYEDDITYIKASTLYQYSGYKFHVGNLLNNIDYPGYACREKSQAYIIQTLKTPGMRIKNVIIRGRGAQAIKNYDLYYLDETNTYIKFHSGTLLNENSDASMVTIPIPNGINTLSVKIQSTSYYFLGPGLGGFYLEYEPKYSENIKAKVIDTIVQNKLFQKVTSPVEII